MNYYEHHLGDYMRDTAHLSMLEDAAYRRLLDAYYIRERALPADLAECCKLARAQSKAERDAVAYVLREFFELRADGHHQDRADREIARFQDKQMKAKRSANARWNKGQSDSDGNANASPNDMRTHMRTHSEGNALQTPDTNTSPSLRSGDVRASRLPTDWTLPQAWREWAETERPDLDASRTAEGFADYWRAKAGKDGRKADWLATWRNWVRNEHTQAQRRAPSDPKYAAAARSIFGVTTPQQEIVDVTPR